MLDLYIDSNSLVADHFSGVGHYTLGLVRALDQLLPSEPNLKVHLAVLAEREENLKHFGLKNILISPINIGKDEFQALLVQEKLPAMDVLLGVGVYFFPDFISWPLKFSKSITTVHDLSFEQVPQFVDDGNRKLLQSAVKNSVRKSNYIATVTNAMKSTIATFYRIDLNRIIVTTNAVDAKIFYKRDQSEIDKIKKKFGIVGRYVLCVGNIEPRKNQEKLLETFLNLPKALAEDLTLVLVGAGGWKNDNIYKLKKKLIKNGRKVLIIRGQVTDQEMPAIYSGADLSINPSFYEGFGMPTVEAMACNIPVIVSNIPVMREVAGASAIYVAPNDIDGIAQGLIRGLTLSPHEKKKMLEANYSRALSYTWIDSANVLLDAIQKLERSTLERSIIKRSLYSLSSFLKHR